MQQNLLITSSTNNINIQMLQAFKSIVIIGQGRKRVSERICTSKNVLKERRKRKMNRKYSQTWWLDIFAYKYTYVVWENIEREVSLEVKWVGFFNESDGRN